VKTVATVAIRFWFVGFAQKAEARLVRWLDFAMGALCVAANPRRKKKRRFTVRIAGDCS
jgi:hypothetical protein